VDDVGREIISCSCRDLKL
jgi:hypothetical protein